MSQTPQLPYGGGGDAQAGADRLSARFRRHADALVRSERSPLYDRLMRSAADDIDAGGVVARLFAGISSPPGSVPQLRLVGALHYLVLAGHAPGLAAFYPSAGGTQPVDGVWPVAQAAMEEQFDLVRARLHRTVQTNEPGRSAVLFAGLLWLTDRHRRPIRLLEVGASAGLNLIADRYSYVVGGRELGDPGSLLRFVDPWTPPPPIDLEATASALRIVARGGCDLSPLDPTRGEDQLTLLSYIWPDELHRIDRMRAALAVAERDRVPVAVRRASEWLPEALDADREDELTVVWHSVMRQYVDSEEWDAIVRALEGRPSAVRLSMEPTPGPQRRMQLTVHDPIGAPEVLLAVCDDHGLPIRWAT
ncbi:MAG: DUF2332 domain-containing protein [Solirubrobacteraceae bacterium]